MAENLMSLLFFCLIYNIIKAREESLNNPLREKKGVKGG